MLIRSENQGIQGGAAEAASKAAFMAAPAISAASAPALLFGGLLLLIGP